MPGLTQILNRPDDADGFSAWDVSGDTPVRYADGFNAWDVSGDTPVRNADGFNVRDVSGDTPVRNADGFNAWDVSGDTPVRNACLPYGPLYGETANGSLNVGPREGLPESKSAFRQAMFNEPFAVSTDPKSARRRRWV